MNAWKAWYLCHRLYTYSVVISRAISIYFLLFFSLSLSILLMEVIHLPYKIPPHSPTAAVKIEVLSSRSCWGWTSILLPQANFKFWRILSFWYSIGFLFSFLISFKSRLNLHFKKFHLKCRFFSMLIMLPRFQDKHCCC